MIEKKQTLMHFYSLEALYRGHLKARRNKRHKNEVIAFELQLGERLSKLRASLTRGRGKIHYYHFIIYEPKCRMVYATDYATRISLHVLCDEFLKPLISKRLIYDNTACQEGKGTHFALKRLTYFLTKFYRKYGQEGYVLKCDIKKYFDEIDHAILLQKLDRIITNRNMFEHIQLIVSSYHTKNKQGKGLPLGNQSSQWFALYYLDRMDRWVKEIKQETFYLRYMDDFLILSPDKEHLQKLLSELKALLAEEKLYLNHKTQIYPLRKGFEFLGFRFVLKTDGKIIQRMRSSSKKRMKRKLKKAKCLPEYRERLIQSYKGHLSHGTCFQLSKKLINKVEKFDREL